MLTIARLRRLRAPVKPCSIHQSYSGRHARAITTASDAPHDPTLAHLRINSQTRVIFQGFTGRQATVNAQESIAWGTNIVGGVTKDRQGMHLDLPLLPTVRRAVEDLKPDATAIYVPARFAVSAIEEALEAEIPLIVAVAEHVPVHDMMRIHQMLRTQRKSRLVGPNSPGIISATDGERCRIGFQPLPCFRPGCVGIAARSGTLSYEAVASTTSVGLGQSLCIGVGGDVLPGTDLVEALTALEADPHTKAIALIGETGGDGELRAAEWVRQYRARTPPHQQKPIAALVVGKEAPLDKTMGHAGAFWVAGQPLVREKRSALQSAGVVLVRHPAEFGNAIKISLAKQVTDVARPQLKQQQQQQQPPQKRSFHTSSRRHVHLDTTASRRVVESLFEGGSKVLQFDHVVLRRLTIAMDTSTREPYLLLDHSSSSLPVHTYAHANPNQNKWVKVPLPVNVLDRLTKKQDTTVTANTDDVEDCLRSIVDAIRSKFLLKKLEHSDALVHLLQDIANVFVAQQAKAVSVCFRPTQNSHQKPFYVLDMHMELEDRSPAAAAAAAASSLDAEAAAASAEAAQLGMTYHRLQPHDPRRTIGTLVNGAGLAMNTVDMLTQKETGPANFLDTGGLATSETVRAALALILRDARVNVVFVNIFGGLTKGDMIARGVVEAVKMMERKVPVVVRIRGTNEQEGQKIIEESGLGMFAFHDFFKAANKAMKLARGVPTKVTVEAEKPEAEKPEAEKPEAGKHEAEKPEAKEPKAEKPKAKDYIVDEVKTDRSEPEDVNKSDKGS